MRQGRTGQARRIVVFHMVLTLAAAVLYQPRAAQADLTRTFLELTPGIGEGVYQLLRRVGLEAGPDGLDAFRELNADRLGGDDSLYPDRPYRMPVYIVRSDRDRMATLSQLGLAEFDHKIDTYNRRFNDAYLTIGGELVLYVPHERSGFYRPDYLIPERVDAAAEQVEIERFTGPYPDVKAEIQAAALDSSLAGYCFVLDPGHGGDDPGTNPRVLRGDGLTEHAFEAPLVYDTAMRLMKYLIMHGAEVYLTHFSPDFGIRNEKDPIEYRSQKYNLSNADMRRDSTAQSIIERKGIVKSIITRNKNKDTKIVFLSIHADYVTDEDMDLPITIFYHRQPNLDGGRSRQFARDLARSVTGSAENTRAQGLGVLYKNPADLEVLIELVNLHNKNGAWRLRDHHYREKLARDLCGGLTEVLGEK